MDRQPVSHPRFARQFASAVETMNRRGAAQHRRRLVARARGIVVELGSGTGANFGFYPPTVERVIAVEPEPRLRALSTAASREAAIPVSVLDGVAESIPVADHSADTVVASLVLCSVADLEQAIAECSRVLRFGGELLFYEHVRSSHRLIGVAEDAVTPLWRRIAGGCHPNRDTVRRIEAGGFEIVEVERFAFAPLPLNPPMAHVLGTARRAVTPPANPRR